jgi:hypothetical protein
VLTAYVTLAITVNGTAKISVRVYEDVVFVVLRRRSVGVPWILRSVDDFGRSNIAAVFGFILRGLESIQFSLSGVVVGSGRCQTSHLPRASSPGTPFLVRRSPAGPTGKSIYEQIISSIEPVGSLRIFATKVVRLARVLSIRRPPRRAFCPIRQPHDFLSLSTAF